MNRRSLLFVTFISVLISPGIAESICEEGRVCQQHPPVCGVPSRCSTSNSLYQRGGSAQAYVPGAAVKTSVCDANLKSTYKASTWPFGRKSKRKAPKVTVNLQLYECSSTTETKKKQCCCVPIVETEGVQIEVWQAKPNGRYSSISKRDDVCRAILDGTSFTTLAPGSTGIMGGLGPAGWDFMPYGAPAIHMLFTSEHHHILVHLPIVLDRKFEPRSFFGPDLRGPAYVTQKIRGRSYSIEEWVVEGDSIELDVNIYLTKVDGSQPDKSKALAHRHFMVHQPPSFWNPFRFALLPCWISLSCSSKK
ncbi:hypothetical protein MHU86_7826 [Fragilaria crotonensis]|nr:hypothetical protein MHU86_7826 [Fragilaria crotonensis]